MRGTLEQAAGPLQDWFAENQRDLPWRRDPSPYHVWVSEIMLQQTRVEAVRPYYERFIAALPGIPDLAECPEDRLRKLWEGLGYYSRVRNMQRTAIILTEQTGGRLPSSYDELVRLPGIGPYTAGAIASIAFGQAVPAVDGNVMRVISRMEGLRDDIRTDAARKHVTDLLTPLMQQVSPGVFNQALMELGALVCLPGGAPLCGDCPVRDACSAHALGLTDEIPVRSAAKARRMEEKTVLVIRDGQYALLHRRPPKGLLAGMYEFPNLPGTPEPDRILSYIEETWDVKPVRITSLQDAKHIFTHVEWHMKGYTVLVEDLRGLKERLERSEADRAVALPENSGEVGLEAASPDNSVEAGALRDYVVAAPEETRRTYPIPAAFRVYAASLSIQIGI